MCEREFETIKLKLYASSDSVVLYFLARGIIKSMILCRQLMANGSMYIRVLAGWNREQRRLIVKFWHVEGN